MFDLLANVMSAPLLVPTDINIDPNTNGLPGINQLRTIVGAVMTIGLILSVLALIVSAIVWGFGANSSNPHLASRGKIGVLVSCGAAVICGASVTLISFFWNVGQSVWPGRRRELVFVMGVCDVPVIRRCAMPRFRLGWGTRRSLRRTCICIIWAPVLIWPDWGV